MNTKLISIIIISIVCAGILACVTPKKPEDILAIENEEFLKKPSQSNEEVFRVLLLSDRYTVVQNSNQDTIARTDDKSGDKYIMEELSHLDKINEVREAVISISLYPDSGRIMKVRPKQLAMLSEVDQLLVEDIQRWNLVSPKKREVYPLKFDIRYRIVLRKKQSDETIIQEVREKMKEKSNQ